MNNKPKYKTTEFWLSLIVLVAGLLLASGVIETGTSIDKGLGALLSVMASFGYTQNRTALKKITENQSPDKAKKPGYKTTEFWATVATSASSAVLASGATGGGEIDKTIGLVAGTIGALGYGPLRAQLKTSGAQAAKLLFFAFLPFIIACTPAKAVDSRYKAIAPEYYNLLHSSADPKYTEDRLQIRDNTIDAWCIDAGLPIALFGTPALRRKLDEKVKKDLERSKQGSADRKSLEKPNGG